MDPNMEVAMKRMQEAQAMAAAMGFSSFGSHQHLAVQENCITTLP